MRYTVRPILIAAVLLLSGMQALAAEQVRYDVPGQTILAQDDGRGRWRERRDDRRDARRYDRQEQRVVPLESIVNGLRAIYPGGRMLDAHGPMPRGDRLIYEIVWVTADSRQILIIVDARTGQVLRVLGQ